MGSGAEARRPSAGQLFAEITSGAIARRRAARRAMLSYSTAGVIIIA